MRRINRESIRLAELLTDQEHISRTLTGFKTHEKKHELAKKQLDKNAGSYGISYREEAAGGHFIF